MKIYKIIIINVRKYEESLREVKEAKKEMKQGLKKARFTFKSFFREIKPEEYKDFNKEIQKEIIEASNIGKKLRSSLKAKFTDFFK